MSMSMSMSMNIVGQFLVGVLCSLWMFYLPIYPLVLLVGCLIMIDTISGIYVAKKTGEKITSKKLSKVLSKVFIYTVIQLLAYSIDYLILQHFIPLMLITRIVAGGLSFIELVSLDEHVRKINDNKGFRYYFSRLKKFVISTKNDVNDMIK